MDLQQTISYSTTVEGVNVYNGGKSRARFHPAKEDSGIHFIVNNARIAASLQNASQKRFGIAVKENNQTVYLVEHMLSAIYALGIDNLDIELLGNTCPTAENCAYEYFQALKPLIMHQPRLKRFWRFAGTGKISVTNGLKPDVLEASSADNFDIECYSCYDSRGITPQTFSFAPSSEIFENEIAKARALSFWSTSFLKNAALFTNRLGLHGVNDTTYQMLTPKDVRGLEPERYGVRYGGQEIVRHKALDVLGTLALTGRYFLDTKLRFHMSGHEFDLYALNKLFSYKVLESCELKPSSR